MISFNIPIFINLCLEYDNNRTIEHPVIHPIEHHVIQPVIHPIEQPVIHHVIQPVQQPVIHNVVIIEHPNI